MAVLNILYHKPSNEIIAIKRASHGFSDEEKTGAFVLAEIDLNSYNPLTREIPVTIGSNTKQIHISTLAKKIPIGDYVDEEYFAEISLSEDIAKENLIHRRLGGE